MIRTFILAGVAAFICTGAAAQATVHYREGQRVEPQEVARILGNPAPAGNKTRSIRLLDEPAATGNASAQPNALSLPVRFDFDSAEINAAARTQLDALAEGIRLLPPGQSVQIEGHTDAVGSDEYNRLLSQRRATSVKQYLVQTQGIAEQRLQAVGVGKQQPIGGRDPNAPQNRRVEFRGS